MRYRRRGEIRSLGDLVGRQLDGLQIARRIREHTAPLVWKEVVGPQVAGATEVLGVDGGVLRVSTKSSVWASELTFYKADILKRLNARLGMAGDPVIQDIHFVNRGLRQGQSSPAPPREGDFSLDRVELSDAEVQEIETALAAVRDDGLKKILRRARLAEARLRTWRLDHGWVPCPRCGELAPTVTDPSETDWRISCPACRLAR